MSRDFAKSRWPEIKEMIKANWDKIEEEEIDSLKGQLHLLSDKIQKFYSYSKERADKEMLEFKKQLNPKSSTYIY